MAKQRLQCVILNCVILYVFIYRKHCHSAQPLSKLYQETRWRFVHNWLTCKHIEMDNHIAQFEARCTGRYNLHWTTFHSVPLGNPKRHAPRTYMFDLQNEVAASIFWFGLASDDVMQYDEVITWNKVRESPWHNCMWILYSSLQIRFLQIILPYLIILVTIMHCLTNDLPCLCLLCWLIFFRKLKINLENLF